MPYQPYTFQDAQSAQENLLGNQAQRRLIDYKLGLEQQNQGRAQTLRDIYAKGGQPTVEQIGAYDPDQAMQYQNNLSLQKSRESEDALRKQNALKGISNQLLTTAERMGFRRDDPSTYGVINQLAPKFKPMYEQFAGIKAQDGPVDVEALIMMADMTPGEKAQQEIQSKVAQEQALQGVRMPYEQQKNQLEIEKQGQLYGMQVNRDKEIEGYKANLGVEKEKGKLDQQADRDYVAAAAAIDEALPLLNVATQSGIGKNIDQVMAYFGQSTEGADAAAALKTIGARLVGFQPKMSGPQSDRDAALYREMSGQIGDDSLPMSRRVKALQSVKNLMDAQAQYRGSEVRGKPVNDAYTGSWGDAQQQPNMPPSGAIVQESKSTGKIRYSTDGGKTFKVLE